MTYNLGIKGASNDKADQGTAAHKVLECLAIGKKYVQDNPDSKDVIIDGESIGELKYSKEDFFKVTDLSFRDINAINKTRINKTTYQCDCLVPDVHSRVGVEVVEDLITRSAAYYGRNKEGGSFTDIQIRDIRNYSWIPLELYNREYDPRTRNIYHPEKSFDIPIDAEWAYYYYRLKGQDIHGQFSTKGTIDLITKIDDNTLEIIDWKGLPINTKIPTINGWSTMGELKIGDMIFDKDGIPTKILGKSKQKNKPCFKIYFDDKTSVICDNEHLWKLLDGRVVPITELKIGDKIPVNKPIITNAVKLPIDPYVLGVWLGDGRNKNGEICSTDEFIYQEILKRGYSMGDNIGDEDSPSRTVYGLVTKLKSLSLLNNKHIPDIYLRASIGQRLDLLRGLMDTDGNVNSIRKQAVFTNCNKTLSDDVKKLLITLGQRVNQCEIHRDTNFKNDVTIYPLHFRPIDINPFLIPRKAGRIVNWGNGNSFRRMVTKIENLPSVITQCIMVDSPTNTYLCTENMIPTHNTGQRKDWATGKEKDYDYLCKDKQLLLYYYAARKTFPKFKNIMITIFFVRAGGPYTICFDDSDLPKAEKMLEEHFHDVQMIERPMPVSHNQSDFKCTKLCHFYKNSFPNSKDNMCKHMQNEIAKKGIKTVIDEYIQPDFTIDKYHSPGA